MNGFYSLSLLFSSFILLFSLNLQAQSDILKKDRVRVSGTALSVQTADTAIYNDTIGPYINCMRIVTPDTIVAGSEFLVELEIFGIYFTNTEKIISIELVETLPVGFMASPENEMGAFKSFKSQKLTFFWTTPPKGKITYKVKMTGLQYGKFTISGKIYYDSVSERSEFVPQNFDSSAPEFKIPPTSFYVTKGIKLKPVNGTLNN